MGCPDVPGLASGIQGNLKEALKMPVNIPWWAKIVAKVVLSRLPFGYGIWQRLGLFRHGYMDQPGYLTGVFDTHVARTGFGGNLAGKTILELGPGDSVGTALVATSHGAKAILLDTGAFAATDVEVYKKLASELSSIGLNPPDISQARTVSDVLIACDARYITTGLAGLYSIESGSVDLIFSQAVLEHVPKSEFLATMKECRRIISPDGMASHRIDLKDHLGGGLNNLRFSDRLWESDFFSKSGFYTNRIRFEQMLEVIIHAGFDVDLLKVDRWDRLPLVRSKMHSQFAALKEDELRVKGFDVILRPIDHL